MRGLRLLWVIGANRKTGKIPTAYVGSTKAEAWESCDGCALRDSRHCYAWQGMNAVIFSGKHVKHFAERPENYTLGHALARAPRALAARIGALGDPARVAVNELAAALVTLRLKGMAIVSYTHFWRSRANEWLQGSLMASCDTLEEADEALAAGWRPAAVLPSDLPGNTFATPGGARGVVCPAQTKDAVTCETCRMCDPQHPVWASGKVEAIGFLEHSRKLAPRGPLRPPIVGPRTDRKIAAS